MYKLLLFLSLLVFSALPFSLLAVENAPHDTLQNLEPGMRKIRLSKFFQQKIQFNLGFDLEPTHSTRLDYIGVKPIVNLGIGYQFKLNDRWAIRPEIWYQQFSTPSITIITDNNFETDGLRIHSIDTTTLLRMAGWSTGLVIKRNLIAGFSVLGGVQCAWYKKGVQESGYFVSDLNGATFRGYTSSFPGYKSLPNWINGFQPSLKIGVEKVYGKRIVLGFNIYQALKDLSDFPDGQKNYSMNFLGYLGVRI